MVGLVVLSPVTSYSVASNIPVPRVKYLTVCYAWDALEIQFSDEDKLP